MRKCPGWLLCLVWWLTVGASIAAEPPSAERVAHPAAPEPQAPVTGRTRDERREGDWIRDAANVVLYIPRTTIETLIATSSDAYGLIENEQVVPRVRDALFTRDGRIGIIPTLFVETGFEPNIGVRMIGEVGHYAMTLRGGWGGAHNQVAESRMRLNFFRPRPSAFTVEGLVDQRSGLGFDGIGPEPATDPRNHFQPGVVPSAGIYRMTRERLIASVGSRPLSSWEVLLSSSYRQIRVEGDPDAGAQSIEKVFVPDSLPSLQESQRQAYSELALRIDTRAFRGPPARGWLGEAYAGWLQGINSATKAVGAGGRLAAFVPVYRVTNIISPRLSLDTITPVGDEPLSFYDYATLADFRGIDPRRDRIAAVLALDYRWSLMKFIAARTFVDTSTVAPSFEQIEWQQLRYAWGLGFDFHGTGSLLAQTSVSLSPQGYRFFLTLGVAPAGFGDRQHR